MLYFLRFRLLLVAFFASFVLTACDPWSSVQDLLTGNWSDILCWLQKVVNSVLQYLLDLAGKNISFIASSLPSVTLPSFNMNIPIIQTAAYFLPISEMATIVVLVLTASLAGFVVMVLLRWLKIIR